MRYAVLAAALACALFVGPASSQCDCDEDGKWYVDNAVSSSGNGTSWSSAWKAFSNISWSAVEPGDTIYVSGGASSKVYNERLTVGKSGVSGSPITIMPGVDSGHSGTVIIDRRGSEQCLNTNRQSFVVVKGFSGRNADDTCVYINGGTSPLVEGWTIFATAESGNGRGIDIRHGIDQQARNNVVTTDEDTDAQTDCFYTQNANDVLIEGNSCLQANVDTSGHSDCFQAYDNGNVTYRGNRCEITGNAGDNHGFWTSDTRAGATYSMINNTITMSGATSALTHWNESGWSGRALIYYNTINGGRRAINCERTASTTEMKGNIVRPSSGGVGFYMVNCPVPAANINGNLVWAPNATIARVNGSSKSWSGWRSLGYDARGVNADPQLADDLSLQAGSLARDAGATLPAVPTDIIGTPRPQGPAFDIGAYEMAP